MFAVPSQQASGTTWGRSLVANTPSTSTALPDMPHSGERLIWLPFFMLFKFHVIQGCRTCVSQYTFSIFPALQPPFTLPCLPLSLFVTGPLAHNFYRMLDLWVPPGRKGAAIKRLLLDRLGFAPLLLVLYFYLMARMEVCVLVSVCLFICLSVCLVASPFLETSPRDVSSFPCSGILS